MRSLHVRSSRHNFTEKCDLMKEFLHQNLEFIVLKFMVNLIC